MKTYEPLPEAVIDCSVVLSKDFALAKKVISDYYQRNMTPSKGRELSLYIEQLALPFGHTDKWLFWIQAEKKGDVKAKDDQIKAIKNSNSYAATQAIIRPLYCHARNLMEEMGPVFRNYVKISEIERLPNGGTITCEEALGSKTVLFKEYYCLEEIMKVRIALEKLQ